jgi:hypothetical protein
MYAVAASCRSKIKKGDLPSRAFCVLNKTHVIMKTVFREPALRNRFAFSEPYINNGL